MHMQKEANVVDRVARIFVIAGALNWGLGIWDINFIGNFSILTIVVYALIGLSGLWELIRLSEPLPGFLG